jgi:hypothetical protein
VGQDIESFLFQVVDLVLGLADHNCHVHVAHPVKPLGEASPRLFGSLGELPFPRCQFGRPCLAHLVVHPHGGGLVDGDKHGLAEISPRREVPDKVRRDLVQPVVASDQVILLAEGLLELLLLLLVQRRLIQKRIQLVLQFVGRKLQLGLPRLVIERHRRAVGDGLREVVDGHVVAENLARPFFLSGNEGSSSEADESRVR